MLHAWQLHQKFGDNSLFKQWNHASYIACNILYYIGGQIESEEQLIARKPGVFRQKQNIDVRIRHEVIEIYIDLAYAPPFSTVWDPVQIVARRLS